MIPYKQHHHAARAHAVERRADQYRSVAGLARALVRTLVVSYVALSAGPALAAWPPDVRMMTQPRSNKINDNCASLGDLVTITLTVGNFGNDLPANQDYTYVTEITDTYNTKNKGMGAHLHSSRVYIPPMPAGGSAVQVKMAVGTVGFYIKKIPGPHALLVHLVRNGVDVNAIGIVGMPIIVVRFPAGYCQPLTLPTPSQMHLQLNTTVRGGFAPGGGQSQRVAPPKFGALRLSKAALRFPPPKIRFISETHHVDTACANTHRLLTFDVRVHNDGGPLRRRLLTIYGSEHGGAYLTTEGTIWVPPLAPGATANVRIPVGVGVSKRNFGQLLPGVHSLNIMLHNYEDDVSRWSIKTVSITLPKGICQPRMPVMSQMHLRPGAFAPRLNPQPEPPSLTPGLRHATPLKKSGAGAAGRTHIPSLLASPAIHLKKKLSPPTMRLMQLPARR